MDDLPIEDQFKMAHLKGELPQMSREQTIKKLIETHRKIVEDDARYKAAIAQHWGIQSKGN